MRNFLKAQLCTLLLLAAQTAGAHALGEGYLFLEVDATTMAGQVEIMLSDLDPALGLEQDGDGRVSEAELAAGMDRAYAYLASRIRISAAGGPPYPISWNAYSIRRNPMGLYLVVDYEVDNGGVTPTAMDIEYQVLFDIDADHRGFLVLSRNEITGKVNVGEETTLIFSPGDARQTLDLDNLPAGAGFMAWVGQGIWHIWIGIDHILFLAALLLPSVLRREGSHWIVAEDFRSVFWNVVKIVTMFTIAHTITLSIAALDVLSLPSRLVESIIAASVVVAALNNIWPVLQNRIAWVVFGFGLFHGFGFASVLGYLLDQSSNLLVALVGFNLGVEIGQVAIVCVLFPLLYLLRGVRLYQPALLTGASAAIALLALGWFTERAFDLDLLPI